MRESILLFSLALLACGTSGTNSGPGGNGGDDGGTSGTTEKVVFVTSGTYNGDFKTASSAADGLAGADALCTKVAHGAGLAGDFQAWLSTSNVDAIDHVTGAGPWVQRPKSGDPVLTFRDHDQLAGTPLADLTIDENGGTLVLPCVWTGTLTGGTHATDTCQGWQSANTFDFGSITESRAATWTAGGSCGGTQRDSCVAAYHLYCFQK